MHAEISVPKHNAVCITEYQSAMKSTIIFASLLGLMALAYGAALDEPTATTSNVDFGTALKMFNIAFQRIMPCGYKPYDIPALAPLSVDFYEFQIDNTNLQVNGNVSNLIISGMNKFRFLNLAYDPTSQRTTFDINYSEMQMLGEYMIDFFAMMAGWPVSYPGSGIINFKVTDLRLVGEFTLAPNPKNSEGLAITDFHMNFYLGDVAVADWNTYWSVSINNFVNHWTREFILMWAQQVQPAVDTIYDTLVLPIANEYLEKVSMPDLINFFVDTANLWNEAACNVA